MMAEMVSYTPHRSPAAAEDDVYGYCDVAGSAGDLGALTVPLPSIVAAPLGTGDQIDGWLESALPVGDPTMVVLWSCQPRQGGVRPTNQP
jgi:hypothetical protein